MMEPLHPRTPAPLHGSPFLQTSHFQLAFDRRPQGSTVTSSHRSDYPSRWGTRPREPIPPPKCANILNQDMDNTWDSRSEYLTSYPAWPLAARPEVCPAASHVQMHTDPRHHVFTSTTRGSYPCPSLVLTAQPSRVDKWDDSIPGGDKEKLPLPCSLYQQSYPVYGRQSPARRAPNQHLGNDSTLKGDGGVRFSSSYQAQYTGWAPPPKRCTQGPISVVLGDPRWHEAVSEQQHAYTTPRSADLSCYNAEQATSQIFRTNIQAGDRRQRFATTMKQSFQQNKAAPVHISYYPKNVSSILQGDEGIRRNERNMTTNRFYYGERSVEDVMPQEPSSLKGQETVCLGDQRLRYFTTTQQSDYPQPPETHKVHFNEELKKSSISFNFPDTGISTATQDMLIPHQLGKHRSLEEQNQKMKRSHLVHPWQGQRWFSTEQREAYTNKYRGPITLATGNLQLSRVPLGTMKMFQHRPKWPSLSHAQEICPQMDQ